MRNISRRFLKTIDYIIAKQYFKYFKEVNSIIIFAFHSILKNEKEIQRNVIEPSLAITIDNLRQLVEYFLKYGYSFIKSEDVVNSLKAGKYVMLTFDDGYFNNSNIIPLLKEYKISASFYFSMSHIENNKCFWWDVLYRFRKKSGVSSRKISKERKKLKYSTNFEIEKYLIDNFGENSLCPICDIDRPFSPSELAELSSLEYISWGNHTMEHTILSNYTDDKIRDEVVTSNKKIAAITGKFPISIAYPNGMYSDNIILICQKTGLKLGVTMESKKNRFPINDQLMTLGRFSVNRRDTIIKQCEIIRSDIHFTPVLLNMANKMKKINQ